MTSLKSIALILGLTALSVRADDSSSIRLSLENTGVDPDATGVLQARIKSSGSTLTLSLANLTPGAIYTAHNGDMPESVFTADSKGRAKVAFSASGKKNTAPFDFDPRGNLFTVRQDSVIILEAVVSGEGESSSITVTERVEMTAPDSASKAVAEFKASDEGQRQFRIVLSKVPGSDCSLYVDGVQRGGFTSKGSGARISFDSTSTKAGILPLDFDPRGKVLDIVQDDTIIFSGAMAAQALNVNVATPTEQLAFIPTAGVDPDGTARAKVKVDKQARLKFSVELEDVPVGVYEMFANDVFVANIQVTTTLGKTEGEVEFSSDDDDSDELPLTFEPTTGVFTIQKGSVVYFAGGLTFANGNGSGGTTDDPAFVSETLSSTGLDSDAHGDAEFEIDDRGRSKFSVEIEDVSVGEYELWVGGDYRGSISATSTGDDIEGEIEFEAGDDDDDELPLTFDPRGMLIEVKSGAGTFFSHTFGNGNGTGPATAQPVIVDLPLFSTGTLPNNATAKMEFERDDDGGESFEVEIEDAPAGTYELSVGGVQRAAIVVAADASGTHGEIEFDDTPKSGQLQLNFGVIGELVTITRNGVTHFQRILTVDP